MKKLIVLILLCCASLSISGPVKPKQDPREQELESLKATLEQKRDSLQNEIATRWQAKQRFVELRETDKESLDQLRDELERVYSEMAQAKEEGLNKAQIVEEEKKNLDQKKEDWKYVSSVQNDILQKQADDIIETIPMDIEERRADLENIRRDLKTREASYTAFTHFLEFKRKYIVRGSSIDFQKKTLLPDNGEPQMMTLIRFGNVFAYGVSPDNSFYSVSQTGRLGAARFAVDKIVAVKCVDFLQKSSAQWVQNRKVDGPVLMDIMQNAQSKVLVAGTTVTSWQKFYAQLKAGGAVMIPLLLLPVWALILTLIKMFQFGRRKSLQKRIYKKVSEFLDKQDRAGAQAFCKKYSIFFARIVETCLANPSWKRDTAEKTAQEILIEELPRLNTNLNTLAVIAGAAPLLGLLGTISGMITLFGAVTYHGTGDPKFLAGGISEALITAKTGLGIAIPVLFIHDYLRNKRDQIQADIERFSIHIINRLWPKE